MSDWQPIETAPKDGTGVLIWEGVRNTVHIVWWGAKGWTTGYETGFNATHWMPLPNPPAPQARGEGYSYQEEYSAPGVAPSHDAGTKERDFPPVESESEFGTQPQPSVGELVERLEHVARTWNNEEAAEAATALKQQAGEIERSNARNLKLVLQINEQNTALSEAQAEIERLQLRLQAQMDLNRAQQALVKRYREALGEIATKAAKIKTHLAYPIDVDTIWNLARQALTDGDA